MDLQRGPVSVLCVQFLLEVARQKNQTPLPLIKPYTGPRLPPDRYCLTAPNYRLKSTQKKVNQLLFGQILLLLRVLVTPVSVPTGDVVRWQNIRASPQRWRRLQQTKHADPR